MVDEPDQVMDLLANTQLFEGLDERQLAHVAARTRIVYLQEGESLPLEDIEEDEDYPFFAVHSGTLCLSPTRWKSKVDEVLRPGDFIGADALFFGARPDYRVTAIADALLLRIESEVLDNLLTEIPRLKDNLKEIVDIYRQVHSKRFEWLGEDEIVHLILRKHAAYLLVSLILPVLLGWLAVLIYIAGGFITIAAMGRVTEWAAFLILFAALIWAIWAFIDWRNDYYIVTDRRLVWLEHVFGLYDSRLEAPLTAIRGEEIQSTLLGRYLGYGDLLVHTLMGRITFRSVGMPEQVKAVIVAQQELARERQHDADLQAMDALIADKLEPQQEIEQGDGESSPEAKPVPKTTLAVERPRWGVNTLVGFFNTRVEKGGTITYRKHIYILFRKVFWPSLLIFLVFAANLYFFWQDIYSSMVFLISAVLFIGFGLWWLYQFIDWRNDIYRITFDKIVDSERKPLGSEVTKSAYLDNILSLDYERLGILGILLNFGNVIINVGTENKFIFWRIHNPARAQQDIFNRMHANRQAKEEAAVAKEREQLAEYLAVYDRRSRATQEGTNASNFNQESG